MNNIILENNLFVDPVKYLREQQRRTEIIAKPINVVEIVKKLVSSKEKSKEKSNGN